MKLKQHTRLSIVVIVIAAVLLEVTTAVQYFTAREGITQQLTEKAQRDLTLSPRIAKVKREVEQAVDKGRFTMVNMGDDGYVSDIFSFLNHTSPYRSRNRTDPVCFTILSRGFPAFRRVCRTN